MKHRNSAQMDRIIPFVNDFYREKTNSGMNSSGTTRTPSARICRMISAHCERSPTASLAGCGLYMRRCCSGQPTEPAG